MRSSIEFLIYGIGSELVLHPIAEALRERGKTCHYIDVLNFNADLGLFLGTLKNKNIYFITSAHLYFDLKSFSQVYPSLHQWFSPVEVISMIRPVKSFFYPHDLVEPLIAREDMFIDLFDHVLIPLDEHSIYFRSVETTQVGWIKFDPAALNSGITKPGGIWLFSDFGYYWRNLKQAEFLNIFALASKNNIAVKFPNWYGADEATELLDRQGINTFAPSLNACQLMYEHEFVIANGISSVCLEAILLGKPVYHWLDDSLVSRERVMSKIGSRDIHFIKSLDEVCRGGCIKEQSLLGPPLFNVDAFMRVIL